MTDVLGRLKPTPVWSHFERLCAIPHPSKHEQAVARHVVEVMRSRGLDAQTDGAGNVIVRKPATPGMENRRIVVLQSHLDMVPQKNHDLDHDFTRDPIRPRIDGDVVRAQGTTLGADNGIGVATALAVLESKDLVHGPLEALFTIDEEAGMTGANKLQPGLLKGDILFNLDSEDEGEICIGCAGGMDVVARLPYGTERPVRGATGFTVEVGGLKGGHSGVDIHLGRANANKVLARALTEAARHADLRLAGWEGGDLRNAIPRFARAVLTVPEADAAVFTETLRTLAAVLRAEYASVDPDLKVETLPAAAPSEVMDAVGTGRLLRALYACPHGAFAMVQGMAHVTETSTNLAIVKMEKDVVHVTSMLRSSVESKKADVANMIRSVFELAGAEVVSSGSYPGWQPNVESPVLAMLRGLYERKFGTAPQVTATHGGLECGIIRAVYPQMDAVSFGPTIRYPHSPDEHVEVASVQKFWDFLVAALQEIPAR